MARILTIFLLIGIFIIVGCKPSEKPQIMPDDEVEKKAILETIKNETKAAFSRDYEAWKTNWVHDAKMSKTYINFADSTFSEMIGWTAIDDFVRTYIEEHREPVPPPAFPDKIEVRIYGNGAWVSYEIMDEVFGAKRETRLMEKEDGKWKIAGLHTTIYGVREKKG